MTSFLLLVASVILLSIGLYLFRIGNLLDVLRGKPTEGKDPATNRRQATYFILFIVSGLILFFSYAYRTSEQYLLPQASQHASDLDTMLWITLVLILFVLVATHLVLLVFMYRYRYRPKRKAYFYHDNTKLELLWIIVPSIVLSILIFKGYSYWSDITASPPENAEVIEVVGYQFAWACRYPGKDGQLGKSDFRLIDADNRTGINFADKAAHDDFMPREIHIPKGKPVRFNIRALDVIHSFYAPYFSAQMYAIPGMPTVFWFTPTKTTQEMREELKKPDFNYEIACNKICGKGHFAMRYIIVVDEPDEYEKWYAQQIPWIKKNPDYLTKLNL